MKDNPPFPESTDKIALAVAVARSSPTATVLSFSSENSKPAAVSEFIPTETKATVFLCLRVHLYFVGLASMHFYPGGDE